MTSPRQEYAALLKARPLSNKYTVKALQVVAETNDHLAAEIAQAIEQTMAAASPEEKEILGSLQGALSQHYKYRFLGERPPSRKRPLESEPRKKERREKESPAAGSEEAFFPYPPEFYLFKLVDKKTYLKSYLAYTKASQPESAEVYAEPTLSREYFVTPRLSLALKMLYAQGMQCKVCGMRFSAADALLAHGELHQRRNQLDKSIVGHIWRPWLLEPKEWGDAQPRLPKVPLYPTLPDETESVLVKGDRDQQCSICKEPFEVVWSDEDENWVFKDALQVRSSPRQLCHKRCII